MKGLKLDILESMEKVVSSNNEWDTLKEVYVGIIDNPNNPFT